MKTLNTIVLIWISCFSLIAQQGNSPARGAQSLAMGGLGINLEGTDALFNNQAGLTSIEGFALQLNSERRFNLNELTAIALGVAYEAGDLGVFGIQISNFGFELYQEQKIGIAYARKLSKLLSIGLQMDWFNTTIETFGSKSLYTFELGIQANVTEEIQLAAHLFNPGQQELNEHSEIPTRLRLGLRYNISDGLYFISEADKRLDSPLNIHTGISYKIINSLDLRAGFNTNPGIFSFGLAYYINDKFSLDGAYSYHENLGYTPGLSIKWK